MVGHWQPSWIVALAASCVIHTGLVGAAMVVGPAPGRAPEPDVLQADLVAPDPPTPAASLVPPPPAKALPKQPPAPVPTAPLTLPKPVETPLPRIEEARAPEVAPPVTREPEPVAAPERTRPERTPETSMAAAATPSTSVNAPAAVTGTAPATRGDDSPGAVTWPAPGAASATAERPGTLGGGATSLARGTGDVTTTAYPRGGYQVRPSYPASARRLGIQGTSLLRVFVAADGKVGDVVVQESAGHPDLDHAATDAVRRWRFEPARRGTDAVAMWVLLPVEFHLK